MSARSSAWSLHNACLAATTLIAAGCTTPASSGSAGLADTSAPGLRSDMSVAQTLQSRPEFSDFRDVIKLAGLWESLDTPQGLTVLAPTNAAFARSDPARRANTQPQLSSQGNGVLLRRQALIQTSEIAGIHPISDFAGKLQDVRTVGGQVIHVDGRTPGVVKITTGPASIPQFGLVPARVFATMETPPLQATNGVIYPFNAITVSDRN